MKDDILSMKEPVFAVRLRLVFRSVGETLSKQVHPLEVRITLTCRAARFPLPVSARYFRYPCCILPATRPCDSPTYNLVEPHRLELVS
jgi:hypothetical protein